MNQTTIDNELRRLRFDPEVWSVLREYNAQTGRLISIAIERYGCQLAAWDNATDPSTLEALGIAWINGYSTAAPRSSGILR